MAKILIVVLALVVVAAAQQRKIGSAGLSLLKQSEGFVPNYYNDQIVCIKHYIIFWNYKYVYNFVNRDWKQ